jgi:hypothetical protein
MKIHDILEGKSENRELWDRIKSKGVVPSIDRERYTDMSGEGLEGPFRMKNGQVLYYDPKEGKYYNRDTDMYVDYDDYRAMNEGDPKSHQAQTTLKHLKKAGYGDRADAANIKPGVKGYRDRIAMLKRAKDEDNLKEDDLDVKVVKFVDWVLLQGDKYKNFTTKPEVYAAAKKAYKAYVKTKTEGVAEGDKRPDYVVRASDKPKKVKPSTGGSSAHPYQGKLVGEAEVGSTDYQWSHGKKPSGHGSWFFVAHRGGVDFSKDVEGEDYIQLNQMTYGEAKKAAIKWAKSKGHTSLFVGT